MVDIFTGTVPNLTQSQPNFDTNTQAILDYIGNLAPQLNEWVGAYVQDTSSTSNTSNSIGTGSKSFTVEAGKGYKVNMPVRASATTGNYMDGVVTAYSGTSLTINFTSSNGSGTFTSWQIFLTIPGSNVTLGSNTFTGDQFVPDEAYDATGWNGDLSVPTKNAIMDKIESLPALETAASDPTFSSNSSTKSATPQWVNGRALLLQSSVLALSGAGNYDINIPSGVKCFTLIGESISLDNGDQPWMRLGTSSGAATTGYTGGRTTLSANTVDLNTLSSSFPLRVSSTGGFTDCCVTFFNIAGTNKWVTTYTNTDSSGRSEVISGHIDLPSALTFVQLVRSGTTGLFDGGTLMAAWQF